MKPFAQETFGISPPGIRQIRKPMPWRRLHSAWKAVASAAPDGLQPQYETVPKLAVTGEKSSTLHAPLRWVTFLVGQRWVPLTY